MILRNLSASCALIITLGLTASQAASLLKPANWGTPDQPWGTRRPVTAQDRELVQSYRAGKKQTSMSTDFKDPTKLAADWKSVTDDKSGLLSCRRPENVQAGGNGLSLLTLNGKDCKTAKWSTGYIMSNFRQKYGFFETSMKIANVNGMNNAFWLTTADGYEIDIAEVRFPNYVHMNLCNWAPSVKDHTVGIGATFKDDFSKSFHDFGVLWSPKEIIFEVDGEPIGVIMTANSISGDADVRFSTGLADWAGGVGNNPEGNDFQSKWVHVYDF